MNDFQMQQHNFQQQQFRDMQRQRRHGVTATAADDAAHTARCEQMADEHAARVAQMDVEYEARLVEMFGAHDLEVKQRNIEFEARVAESRAAMSTLANINSLDDVRAYFERNR